MTKPKQNKYILFANILYGCWHIRKKTVFTKALLFLGGFVIEKEITAVSINQARNKLILQGYRL